MFLQKYPNIKKLVNKYPKLKKVIQNVMNFFPKRFFFPELLNFLEGNLHKIFSFYPCFGQQDAKICYKKTLMLGP